MLTPKVKQHLERWLYDNYKNYNIDLTCYNPLYYLQNELSKAAQFGILQDYFWQEHDIYLGAVLPITNLMNKPIKFRCYLYNNDGNVLGHTEPIECPNKARLTAITKASELIEDRL